MGLRIAQIAPLAESVPPKLYGGTERVVSYLTEELVEMGHQVTLFASGDSKTKAELVAPCPQALRLDKRCYDYNAHQAYMLELLYQEAHRFDIIHSHLDYLPFSQFRRMSTANLTTMHGRLDLFDVKALHQEFSDMPVVSISLAQRSPVPYDNWVGNVYHGIPENLLAFHEKPGSYLAFLGRICPEKRVDLAIEIAKRVGMKLKIAAKVDPADQTYFEKNIEPLLHHPLIEYIGEIGEDKKGEFLGNAYALLFPIDWPEPFGMVLIEAWACGTPVISCKRGSVPELVAPGISGFICENVEEAAAAVKKINTLDRRKIRAYFETRFSSRRMAQDYLKVYFSLLEGKEPQKKVLQLA
jgi:glycosyltransferase involved in cell wall biosynthesis